MPVTFHNHDVKFALRHKRKLKQWVSDIIMAEGKQPDEINFVFGSDKWLLSINNQYLRHDYFTDVITFDHAEEEKIIAGDICISIERVRENAKDMKVSFEEELHRVMIHGVLHLIGYGDKEKEDKKEMTRKESLALKKLGIQC